MRFRLRLIWQLLAVVVVSLIGGQVVANVQENDPWLMLVCGIATAIVALLVYRWAVGRTEQRPVLEAGREGLAGGLAVGTLIGLGVFGLVMANIAFLGYYEVTGRGSLSGAAGLVGYMAAAAVTEELMFRGVLFRVIEDRAGTWIAMLISGVLFGLYHLGNADADLYGAIAVAIEAGGMLTAAYIATRKLWVPIGLHFGWNFAGGGIFSTEVSGNGATHGLLSSTLSGPKLLTGGDFGPEGSVYSLALCVITAIVFLLIARHRGTILPRRGRRIAAVDAEQPAAVATLHR